MLDHQPPVLTPVSAINVELQILEDLSRAIGGLASPIEVDADGPDQGMVQPIEVQSLAFPDGVPWVPEHRLVDWLRSLPPQGEAWCGLIRRRADTLRSAGVPSVRGQFDRFHLGAFVVVREESDERPSWETSIRRLLALINRVRNLIDQRTNALLAAGLVAEGLRDPALQWEGVIDWPSRVEGRGLIGEGMAFSLGAWAVPGVRLR